MSPELREALRGLCCGGGWSYGAVWRPHSRDSRLLMMEECYHEEEIVAMVDEMRNKVHMVGKGTLGAAAVSGKHQMIYSDACIDLCRTSSDDNSHLYQGKVEWNYQFNAGIKTIVLIPLPSLSVVQFGSLQKISESSEFVEQVKSMFQKRETTTHHFLDVDVDKGTNINDPHAEFSPLISSGDAYSSNSKIDFLHDDICNPQLGIEQSANPILPPTSFSLASLENMDFYNSRPDPLILDIPEISSSTAASKVFSNSNDKESYFRLKNQYQFADNGAEGLISPTIPLESISNIPQKSAANYLCENMLVEEIATLPMLEQRLFSGMATQGFPNLVHRKSSFSSNTANQFHHHGGGSSEQCLPHGSQGMLTNSNGGTNAPSYGTEKYRNFKHSSLSLPNVDLSTNRYFSKDTSYISEPLDEFFISPQDLSPEHSALIPPKDGLVSDVIHPSDRPLKQFSSVRTLPIKDDALSTCCVSSGMVGSETAVNSYSTGLLSKPVDHNSVATRVNFVEAGSEAETNSSDAPAQLFSDSDMFDGMELDLTPRIMEQGCWDEILLPVGSGSCSNISTSASDCIDIGHIEGADKGVFSDSTLEQLLDAIVAENINSSSSNQSVGTSINSIGCLDLEHQFSKTTKVGDSLIQGYPAPHVGQPSFDLVSDISLPGRSSEKIMQVCQSEALAKSHVHSWIDDSFRINSESAVLHQSKKPDSAGKVVRKRARPGESTRPRPKDRQQIQDRVKELRQIVPNGAKCSIDSLLDRTIKHMLFLQSATKYADKLKQADEPKMIGDESGVVLKDNSSSGGGGATWAYEVSGQTMVCPILVEDLNPPGQMLIEMLCEERGFFLEIADIIRGFGLTILKGVMEVRDSKIWARFVVEANRDITRMDIFLSLVQLLQQTSCIRSSDYPSKAIDKMSPTFTDYQQFSAPLPICLADRVQ